VIIAKDIDDAKDVDANTAENKNSIGDADPETQSGLNIFSFPAGAHTGTCWHNIFELLDFQASDDETKEVVNTQLSLARLDIGDDDIAEKKRELTFRMIKNVLEAKLQVEDEFVKLADVNENEKLAEMNFDFSLDTHSGSDDRNAIFKVLNEEWKDAPEGSDEKAFLDRLQNWETKIPSGFMTGSVDLLFKQNGKYYILDWKSNSLNRDPKGFDRPGLVSEMASHSYFLQYLIYTVAVHRYLRQCLGDAYDYDRDFGGALYIFLRGVDQRKHKETQNGVFYKKPKKELIEKLGYALTGEK
jgi:exodeoxyribonuclease V beta subunit